MRTIKAIKEAYREAAKKRYHDEGTIEVDDKAKVSVSADGGAYVQAWVWVANDESKVSNKECQRAQ